MSKSQPNAVEVNAESKAVSPEATDGDALLGSFVENVIKLVSLPFELCLIETWLYLSLSHEVRQSP
jgi:hypothetical protein